MDDFSHKIEQLSTKLSALIKRQETLNEEILAVANELVELKALSPSTGLNPVKKDIQPQPIIVQEKIQSPVYNDKINEKRHQDSDPAPATITKRSFSLEEFVGGNIASKVGILITMIGIFIGAKYAIEHNLVKPVVRVVVGYAAGSVLIFVAARLKRKYENYSSVLMGGGLAVFYFLTYIAFSFYKMFPQSVAFGLMLLFTIATVYAAIKYNRVIIAHLALVGAYSIPFLLSNNTGRFEILFLYMIIINCGILFLAFWKYWKSLYYLAFLITWLIYGSWFYTVYENIIYRNNAFLFLSIFFVIFYATSLAYKLIKKEQYGLWDVVILLSNAFIFYGFGFALIESGMTQQNTTGMFTLVNGLIHLAVALIIKRLKLADHSLYYLLLGLMLVFFTIMIPVRFDGNWVTLLWAVEAVVVFVIGRTRGAVAYEKIAAVLIMLGFFSLVEDWIRHIDSYSNAPATRPFFNIVFFTGLLVLSAQAVIQFFHRNNKYPVLFSQGSFFKTFYNYFVPVFLLVTAYFTFQIEIQGYFELVQNSMYETDPLSLRSAEVSEFGFISYLLYSMIFIAIVIILNNRIAGNTLLTKCCLSTILLLICILLFEGFSSLNELSFIYYRATGSGTYFGIWDVLIRYIVILIAMALLYLGYTNPFLNVRQSIRHAFSILIHTTLLGFISFEYLKWTNTEGSDNQYSLGLSIIWGLYALFLIISGIYKKAKHLRIAAIILFIITLAKWFIYDLSEAGTITKTISFVSLGVILLLISYLYNRFKDIIIGDEAHKPDSSSG